MNKRGERAGALAGRVAKVILLGVLFTGLFIQIGMLASISEQTKQIDAVDEALVELNARRENLELSLSKLESPERIEQLATLMGMDLPQEDAIRVVSVSVSREEEQTQTAQLPGGEGAVR